MTQKKNSTITVPEVIRDMNVEVSPSIRWTIGNEIKRQWIARYGCLPDKELRNKADGSNGSHVLAVYPEKWRSKIEELVSYYKKGPKPQLKLDLK